MRRLAIDDHGLDVRHLQEALNARSRARKLPPVHVDGVFGRDTRAAAERVARALGAREDSIIRRPLTVGVQRIIRWPKTRTPVQLLRARQRKPRPAPRPSPGAFGIDWAWGTPNVKQLQAAGVKFACRYLSNDPGKNLTRAQALQLAGRGIDVVVVWETTANRALSGHAAGVADAQAARKQARGCGIPTSAPIYFAVDFDVTVAQSAAVAQYFRGVAEVLGVSRTGAYGGYHAIKRLFDSKLIRYGWQTYAWSGGAWDARAQLRQYSNGHVLAGVGCDYNRSTRSDFGQWRPVT